MPSAPATAGANRPTRTAKINRRVSLRFIRYTSFRFISRTGENTSQPMYVEIATPKPLIESIGASLC